MFGQIFAVFVGLAFAWCGVGAYRSLDADGRITRYAQSSNILRVIVMGTLFSGLLGLLTVMCSYGLVLHVQEVGLFGSVELQGGTGKRLPPGTYTGWTLIVFLSGCVILFGGVLAAVLRGGVRGLRARL